VKLKLWILFAAVGLAVAAAPFACPWPDGFEYVAAKLGVVEEDHGEPLVSSPLPDYSVPDLASDRLGTSVAGLLGVGVMFVLVYGLGRALANRGKPDGG